MNQILLAIFIVAGIGLIAGLGLAIAKWIVERHGGWFEVLSREGIGTRMTMVLPLARLGED